MDRDKMLEKIDKKRALFGMLFALDNNLQAAGDTFYEEVTAKQFYILMCLYLFQGDNPTIGELSEIAGSSHQNVKQIINKLEKTGIIKTYPDSEDKRKLRIMYTEEMTDFSEKYNSQENEFIGRLYQGISNDEIVATYETISKIDKNLTKIREENK